MINSLHNTIAFSYHVHGAGGQGACMAIQSVLQEHGLCGHTEWTATEWRFVCITHLELETVTALMGDLTKRFKVTVNLARPWLAREGNLTRAGLKGADLSGTNLARTDLSGADLRETVLVGADLRKANLSGANLHGADLAKASLSEANLSEANLNQANLYRADLCRADLSRADLSEAVLSGANLEGAIVSNEQLASAQSLQGVIFPDAVRCAVTHPHTASGWIL